MIYSIGEDYYVRVLHESDVSGMYPMWFQDQEVCKFNSHGKFFKTESHLREYIIQQNFDREIVWAICHSVDGHIGNISLQEISFVNRSAEFAIIIGDKRHWGKGVGLKAGKKLLEHGFKKLNLKRVGCGLASTNTGMKNLAIRLGMSSEGQRRQALYLDGERVDILEFGILDEDFFKL